MGSRLLCWSALTLAGGTVGVGLKRSRQRSRPVPASTWLRLDWDQHVRDGTHPGGRLCYVDYGEGPALVLLHGMAGCWQWWLECLPELGRHYRVIAVDLPGFGESEPMDEPAEIANYAEAIAILLHSLGVERAAVAGHSMGGLVAIALAESEPDLVARLVLVGSGGVPMSERHLTSMLRLLRFAHRNMSRPAVLRLIAESPRARRTLLRGAMRDPAMMSNELAALLAPKLNAPAFADSIRASASAVRASRPEAITTPTALIWGEYDRPAPLHTARAMLELLPAGTLDVIRGVGHSPMIEAPEEFTRLLVERADFTLPATHPPTR